MSYSQRCDPLPSSGGVNDPITGERPRRRTSAMRHILTIAFTILIVYITGVVRVMMRSRRIYQSFLYASYACYAAFFLSWITTVVFIQRRDPQWEITHRGLIQFASASVVLAGLLWTIALFPVFHIWTIPLGVCILQGFLSAVSLVSSVTNKYKPN